MLYTDGVTEARNGEGEEFGEDRLVEGINADWSRNAGQTVDDVLKSVHRFANGTMQHDDITLIAARRR